MLPHSLLPVLPWEEAEQGSGERSQEEIEGGADTGSHTLKEGPRRRLLHLAVLSVVTPMALTQTDWVQTPAPLTSSMSAGYFLH